MQRTLRVLNLDSPTKRLATWAVLSTIIFLAPFSWLQHLSLWQRLGLDWAPSIGLTRAYWHLLHGNPASAWQINPLIYAVITVGLPMLGRDICRVMQIRTTTDNL
jgi:Protein of unknown function (DUF2752)